MNKPFYEFKVTDKKNLTMREAFEVAQDILEDISSTLKDFPKFYEFAVKNIEVSRFGTKEYTFEVIDATYRKNN